MAANQVPDEIISEIISPLLSHSDAVFSEHSEKALLEAGYSLSTYLLVCKAWLRVSTPLLYNVVILRTTAQAVALAKVLAAHPEIGLFVKKLRLEGGFGSAMDTILAGTPNITDLFLTLLIESADSVQGLCSGLALVNPRRVIVFDISPSFNNRAKPKKNKHVTKLLEALVANIAKWDKLEIFDLPYRSPLNIGDAENPRSEALTSALGKSQSLHTLIAPAGYTFPNSLRQLVDLPSFKSLQFTMSRMLVSVNDHMFIFRPLYTVVDGDPKLKALVTYTPDLRPNMSPVSTTQHNNLPGPSASPTPSAPSSALARKVRMLSFIRSGSVLPSAAFAGAKDVPTLKTLGETWGDSLQELCVVLDADYGFSASSKRIPPLRLDPALLAPFTAVTHITWQADHPKLSFTSIPEGFSALPNLKSMATIFESPALLAMGLRLPLNCLEDVDLDRSADVPTSVAFLRLHGPKLTRLSAPLEIIVKIDVFDLCTNLTHLAVLSPFPKSSTALPADFLSCSTPHTTILKIEFVFHRFTPQQASAFKEIFTNLDAADLPALKEIKVKGIEWPTSEHTVRKNKWIPLAKVLRSKGIKLTDTNGSSPRLDGLEVVA